MFLIVLVIIYVPYQTGKILELYNSLNFYQRARYSPSSSHSHVIIGGAATYSDIIDFCREYFVADSTSRVVILHPEKPDVETRRFLNHPFYRNRILFLQGDVLSAQDLKRANAENANGLFLINNTIQQTGYISEEDEIRQTRGLDAGLLMQALVAKNTYPGMPIFAQVKDTRSKELADHCGCDRVLCVEEIQASLYAANSIVPGTLALIPNLIHSYAELGDSMNDIWIQEYKCGIANQVFSFKIPQGLFDISFIDVVQEVFTTYNAIIFGLVSANAGFNQNPIRIGIPRDYRIKADDIALCISENGDEIVLRISLDYKDSDLRDRIEKRNLENEIERVLSKSGAASSPQKNEYGDGSTAPQIHPAVPLGKVPPSLSNHIILCGHLNSRKVRHFIRFLRSRESLESRIPLVIVCILEKVPEEDQNSIWTEIMTYGSIFICQGTPMKKMTFMRAQVSKSALVLIFTQRTKEMKDAISVFLVKMIQTVLLS